MGPAHGAGPSCCPGGQTGEMSQVGKRSFWLHQLAEYVVGASLLATGLQSPDPLVPTLVGAVIVVNAAIVEAPLSAYRLVSRRLHRMFDALLVLASVAVAVLADIDSGTRLVVALIAVVFVTIVWRTDYSTPEPKVFATSPQGRADELGRLAGRATGRFAARFRRRE